MAPARVFYDLGHSGKQAVFLPHCSSVFSAITSEGMGLPSLLLKVSQVQHGFRDRQEGANTAEHAPFTCLTWLSSQHGPFWRLCPHFTDWKLGAWPRLVSLESEKGTHLSCPIPGASSKFH